MRTADVCSSSKVHEKVEVNAGTTGILSQEAISIGFGHSPLQILALMHKLSTNVDVTHSGTHRSTSNQTAFHELVWVMAHDFSVLAGPRFGLISIHYQIVRSAIRDLWHERPLEAARKTCTSSASEAGLLHLVHNPVTALDQYVLRPVCNARVEYFSQHAPVKDFTEKYNYSMELRNERAETSFITTWTSWRARTFHG